MAEPITFVLTGVEAAGSTRGVRAAPPAWGTLKKSVVVTAERGAGAVDTRASAVPGEDIVVIDIAGGPSLWLHPENARDLLQSQQDSGAARGDGEVRVPGRLKWRLEETTPASRGDRSFLGDVLVRAVHIVTGDLEDEAADFVASKVVQAFDGQVNAGVYRLSPNAPLPALKQGSPTAIAGAEPALVLIHGTFSQTAGTFGKLWTQHPQLAASLFDRFHDRVFALDHPTLGASPIANAITLAKAASPQARLHLLTHSRGGLVAETLARVCANPNLTNMDLFANDGASAEELKELAELVKHKGIVVERVVRVACPARGTLLASKRLDAYVSVLKWALELAQVPVAPELVNFLGEVAQRRADPDKVPGLAAQVPDSALIRWLHASAAPIRGDLRVVAGDLRGDSVVSWVKALLSDGFFWTDNDLVVQTRSMYGGTPRETQSTFLLDTGGKVSHFNYFSNAQTANAIVGALNATGGTSPEGFGVIGPLSWAGDSSTGSREQVARAANKAADLPALFLLPGILGSNLKVDDQRIWLGWRLVTSFSRLAYVPNQTNVAPDGPIGFYYDDLLAALSNDYDVQPFAFDWRRPILSQAESLAEAVAAALDARQTSGRPVRILAHSMGGLVARAMQIAKPLIWNRMMQTDGARVVMLGTPNAGSWTPMQVLSGDDSFGNLLANVGAPFSSDKSRQLIADLPGFLQLQARLLDKLGQAQTWKDLADADLAAVRASSPWHSLPLQLAPLAWGLPSQAVLDEAAAFRRALDKQRDNDLAQWADKLLLVVGKAATTPAGYESSSGQEFVYLDVADGDGRVTAQSAELPGVATWQADCDHGSLPRYRPAFEAYRELLDKGATERLARVTTAGVRGPAAAAALRVVSRSRPSRRPAQPTPPQRELDVQSLTSAATAPQAAPSASLSIDVINGDLTYISDALLMGHYRSSRLTGAELTMDRALNYAMSASLQRGLYATAPGTCQIFVNVAPDPTNPWRKSPRPQAVIVAGLGPEGELRGSDLVNTVRQAVIAWARRLTEIPPVLTGFSLSTTLLGSGGSGVTAGQAAQLIALGVREANEQIAKRGPLHAQWPRVERLRIVELYLDRASEAWSALQTLAESAPALYTVAPLIERAAGARRRPPEAGYRGVDYDFISALILKQQDDVNEIGYTINSRRARNEVRPQPVQAPLIRNLVTLASSGANAGGQIGRTLFTLLAPADLEPFLSGGTETVLELDQGTAPIPWEILEAPGASHDRKPWSIRTKLLRKLRTPAPSLVVNGATADDDILVIGDPACERSQYPVLLGARREALEVAACLTAGTAQAEEPRSARPRVTSVISDINGADPDPDATKVICTAFDKHWRIIHVAGHGQPPTPTATGMATRGVVLSGGSFLGPIEIENLRVKPELVFVNCCHLAADDPRRLLKSSNYDRAWFASGVAYALIRSGVRCVIAAGWAVDDDAARVFAREFYTTLLAGRRFIDAVAAAREKTWACGGTTWAAYQCYGDPEWLFRPATSDAQGPSSPPPPGREFATIASAPALILALEEIAIDSEFRHSDVEHQARRLRYLEVTFERYRNRGDVAEAFGNAWAKWERFEEASTWYERARQAQDGTASLVAIEQLANARSRKAWNAIKNDPAPTAERIDWARAEIDAAMKLLNTLQALAPTDERASLYGSSYKRLAMLEAKAGRPAAAKKAVEQMLERYTEAETIARDKRGTLFYPAMNRIAAQLALCTPLDSAYVEEVRQSLKSAAPDFWSVVGQTELDLIQALAAGELSEKVKDIKKEFEENYARVANARWWGSVFDNATFLVSCAAAQAQRVAAQPLLDQLAQHAGRPATAGPA